MALIKFAIPPRHKKCNYRYFGQLSVCVRGGGGGRGETSLRVALHVLLRVPPSYYYTHVYERPEPPRVAGHSLYGH